MPVTDYKGALQEMAQALKLPQPRYSIVEERGPEHAKTFLVEVRVGQQMVQPRLKGCPRRAPGRKPRSRILQQRDRGRGRAVACGAPRLLSAGLLRGDLFLRRPLRLSLCSRLVQNHDVDAPILPAAFFGVVTVHRRCVGVAGDGEPVARHAKVSAAPAGRCCGPPTVPSCCGSGNYGSDRVGVAFHAHRIGNLPHRIGDLAMLG